MNFGQSCCSFYQTTFNLVRVKFIHVEAQYVQHYLLGIKRGPDCLIILCK